MAAFDSTSGDDVCFACATTLQHTASCGADVHHLAISPPVFVHLMFRSSGLSLHPCFSFKRASIIHLQSSRAPTIFSSSFFCPLLCPGLFGEHSPHPFWTGPVSARPSSGTSRSAARPWPPPSPSPSRSRSRPASPTASSRWGSSTSGTAASASSSRSSAAASGPARRRPPCSAAGRARPRSGSRWSGSA